MNVVNGAVMLSWLGNINITGVWCHFLVTVARYFKVADTVVGCYPWLLDFDSLKVNVVTAPRRLELT